MSSLTWRIHEDGYSAVSCRNCADLVIVPHNAPASSPYSNYQTNDYPTLYATFSQTALSKAGVISFANRYGLLGLKAKNCAESSRLETLQFSDSTLTMGATGEFLESWYIEIRIMRFALTLWAFAQDGDKARIKKILCWETKRGGIDQKHERYVVKLNTEHDDCRLMTRFINFGFIPAHDEKCLIPDAVSQIPVLNEATIEGYRITRYDVILPAKIIASWIVNVKLQEYSTPRLSWQRNKRGFTLDSHPTNLIGYMWHQFAMHIAGLTKPHLAKCVICQTYFHADRSTAQYCTPTCKKRAQRARKRENTTAVQGS